MFWRMWSLGYARDIFIVYLMVRGKKSNEKFKIFNPFNIEARYMTIVGD